MRENIIGRQREIAAINECLQSDKPELVAIYGRRRVGKTFLVKQLLEGQFCFYMTGVYQWPRQQIFTYFAAQLSEYSGVKRPKPKTWFEAFEQLRNYLTGIIERERLILFLDELPWLDTPRSDFLRAFDLFWNGWAAEHANIKLIVCGSATTWMTDKLLGDKGGLHNRVTQQIYLAPFRLSETEAFLKARGIVWTRHQIAECYMIMGGTPYYLDMLDRALSLPQNIDRLFFAEKAELASEYGFLFRSLFGEATLHQRIVELLAKHAKGMRRDEIVAALKVSSGGKISEALTNLINCDFIRRYSAFGQTTNGGLYQLTDLYSLFYLRFVKGHEGTDKHLWTNTIDAPAHRAWSGYAFEQVCLHHIAQIKQALGISGVQTNACAWSLKADAGRGTQGAQIDLVLDRRDQIVNLCEVKYALQPFDLTPAYWQHVMERRETFRQATGTRKALHITFITAAGLVPNAQSACVQSQVTLDDLFAK